MYQPLLPSVAWHSIDMDAPTDFTDLLTKTELQSVVDTPFCDCMCSGVARTSPLLGHSMGTLRLCELPREVQKLTGGSGGILPQEFYSLPGRF